MRLNVVLLCLMSAAAACGSSTPGAPGGGGGAAGGTGGGGGRATGGAGAGGGAGSSGAGGSSASGGATSSGGAGGSAGSAGIAGTGGPPGSGGRGGMSGAGGGGKGGSTGMAGGGGAGSSCQEVLALDRSCTTAADCFGGGHVTNCCGQRHFIGIRVSEQARFQSLEAQCDASYPACGCAEQQPLADDGSRLRWSEKPGVTCQQGICTTFVSDCAGPCASGTTCFSCSNHSSMFSACTRPCSDSTACTDPGLPLCQMGSSGNVPGMFCTASNVACDTK